MIFSYDYDALYIGITDARGPERGSSTKAPSLTWTNPVR